MPFGRVATQSGHFRRPDARWSKWNLKTGCSSDKTFGGNSLCRESFRDSSQDHEKIQKYTPKIVRTKNRQQNVCIRFNVPAVRRPTLVRQEGNLGSGYKNTDLKWSRKRIEISPEVIVQVHRLNLIDRTNRPRSPRESCDQLVCSVSNWQRIWSIYQMDQGSSSYPEGRSTIHEPGRRQLPTQSYVRLLSWLDTNLSRQELEEEDLVPASSDEGLW